MQQSVTDQQDKVNLLERRVQVFRATLRHDEDRYDQPQNARSTPWGWALVFITAAAIAGVLMDVDRVVVSIMIATMPVFVLLLGHLAKNEASQWHERRAEFLNLTHELALADRERDLSVRAQLRERYGVDLPSCAVDGRFYTVASPEGVVRVKYVAGSPGYLLLGDRELPR